MAVVLVHHTPDLTQETYGEIVRKLTGGERSRMEAISDWPVEGILSHAAGDGPNGFRVVDVWESEEAASAFAAKLGPILEEVGVNGEPEVYPAHAFVAA